MPDTCCPIPTPGPGVTRIADDTYEVTVRITTDRGDKRIRFALRLEESLEESKLVFSPLLNRFLKGGYQTGRKISEFRTDPK